MVGLADDEAHAAIQRLLAKLELLRTRGEQALGRPYQPVHPDDDAIVRRALGRATESATIAAGVLGYAFAEPAVAPDAAVSSRRAGPPAAPPGTGRR